jgi:PIN domain nuclease of toxin-antitoxin system
VNRTNCLGGVLELFEKTENNLVLSVASVWEMQIKIQLGKLDLEMPIKELIESQQQANDLQILPVELRHVFELNNLTSLHNDPFDRILIAQSNAEGLTIVSKDQKLSDYPVTIIW